MPRICLECAEFWQRIGGPTVGTKDNCLFRWNSASSVERGKRRERRLSFLALARKKRLLSNIGSAIIGFQSFPYSMKTQLRKQINNALADAIPNFAPTIPIGKIFNILNCAGFIAIQEDGEPWSGLLCGHSGSASIQLRDVASGEIQREAIQLQWWGEDVHGCKGKIETNVYVM